MSGIGPLGSEGGSWSTGQHSLAQVARAEADAAIAGARSGDPGAAHRGGERSDAWSIGLTVLVVLALGAWLAFLWADDGGAPTVPLSLVPEGASAHVVDGEGVILVRSGDEVRGLLAATVRGELVQLCVDDEQLVQYDGGSRFTLDGTKLGGPSPEHLSTVRVVLDGRTVAIHLDDVERRPIDGVTLPPAAPLEARSWADAFAEPPWCPGDAPS